ncbi:hypothetical protein BDZ45DRAFT_153779 [Acephala macrosclerotiorum]|nr:hypothetical protein BDZ45DRAFT_153779 [Acephala macrosclerotiorum]
MKSKLIANPNMSRYFLIHAWQDYAIDSIMCPVITLSPYQRVLQMRKKRQPPPKPQQKPASQPLEIYEPTPKSLVKLPAEIHLQIFSYLDECTSCCLGLTCKTFYAIHHKKHPVTDPACASYGERFETVYLYELLNGFMSRSWCFHQAKMSGYWENDFQTEKLEMEIDCLKAKLYRSYSTYF